MCAHSKQRGDGGGEGEEGGTARGDSAPYRLGTKSKNVAQNNSSIETMQSPGVKPTCRTALLASQIANTVRCWSSGRSGQSPMPDSTVAPEDNRDPVIPSKTRGLPHEILECRGKLGSSMWWRQRYQTCRGRQNSGGVWNGDGRHVEKFLQYCPSQSPWLREGTLQEQLTQ